MTEQERVSYPEILEEFRTANIACVEFILRFSGDEINTGNMPADDIARLDTLHKVRDNAGDKLIAVRHEH